MFLRLHFVSIQVNPATCYWNVYTKLGEWTVMYMFNRCIFCFLDFVSIQLNPATFYWNVYTKLGEWTVMYMFNRCIFCFLDVVSISTIFLFDYRNISRVWYSLVFNLSERSCIYVCCGYLLCLCLCDFSIRFWNCSEDVVCLFFVFILLVSVLHYSLSHLIVKVENIS